MTRTIIKRIAGIVTAVASTQAILFWIGSEGKLWQLAIYIVLACISCWCFTDKEEDER